MEAASADSSQLRKSETARTLSAAAADHIRSAVLSCRLLPGQRLKLDSLKETLGVGYSPLREALMQVSSEGLVVLNRQRGFIVAPVSIDDLTDVMETRISIEARLLADALARGDDHWEAEIAAAFHRLSKVNPLNADQSANDEWFSRHRDFHFSLVAASRSELTKRFWSIAYDRAERYRRLAITYGSSSRSNIAEHEELMHVAFSRDVAKAQELAEQHIRRTLDILIYDVADRVPIFDASA